MDPVDHMDQVRNCDCIHDNTRKFQVDHMDQVAQEALEDQGHIIQLEHQADQKDLAVLEDQVAQAAEVDQEAKRARIRKRADKSITIGHSRRTRWPRWTTWTRCAA